MSKYAPHIVLATLALSAMLVIPAACAQTSVRERIRDRIADRTAPPVPHGQSSTQARTLTVQGEERLYRVYVPALPNSGTYALLFAFHGYSSNATEQEIVGNMKELADRDGVVIVYPEGLSSPSGKQFWRTQASQDRETELTFVKAMLTQVQSAHPVDPDRIYATGISNGGGMANMVAAEMSDVFAAIAPVAGAYYDYTDYSPSEAVAIMAFHGTLDRIVPIGGRAKLPAITAWSGNWASINGCATTPVTIRNEGQLNWKRWGDCASPVNLITIEGEGHTWPGSPFSKRTNTDINVSEMMFDFFRRHPKRR